MFNSEITIIIPVAGCGKRTKSHGPKCLLKVSDDLSLLKRQLKLIQQTFPKSQIVVVAGFKYNKVAMEVKRFNLFDKVSGSLSVIVVENENYETTNVARSISIGLSSRAVRESLIIYGDLVFSENFLKNFTWEKSNIIVDNNGFVDKREVGAVCCNGMVTNMSYGLPEKWSHVLYLNSKDSLRFKEIEKISSQTTYGFEILNKMIDENIEITYSYNDSWIVEVDNMRDLKKARESLEKYEASNL